MIAACVIFFINSQPLKEIKMTLLTREETVLFAVPSLFRELFSIKEIFPGEIDQSLIAYKRDSTTKKADEYGAGFYYTYKSNNFFIGFSPCCEKEFFLSLAIEGNQNNSKLGKKLYFRKGWYYIPLQNSSISVCDKKVLSEVRKRLRKIDWSLPNHIYRSLPAFFSMENKIIRLIEESNCRNEYNKFNCCEWFYYFENQTKFDTDEFKSFLFADSYQQQLDAFKEWIKLL